MADSEGSEKKLADLRQRLREVVDRAGGIRATAAKTGIPERTIANWLGGKAQPKADGLKDMGASLGVSVDWLLFGESQPATSGEAGSDGLSGYIPIPILSVEVSAGHGALVEGESTLGTLALPRRLLRARQIDPNEAHIIYVRGDSMEPTLREGDVVLVDRSGRLEIPRPEAIYVVRAGNELLIKRLVFGGQRTEQNGEIRVVWRLVSDNPAYPPTEVDFFSDVDSDVEIIGRVRMVMRWM